MHQCCRTVTTNCVFLRMKKNLVNLSTEQYGLDIINIEVEAFHLRSSPLSL